MSQLPSMHLEYQSSLYQFMPFESQGMSHFSNAAIPAAQENGRMSADTGRLAKEHQKNN
jgi:hypothetical protein